MRLAVLPLWRNIRMKKVLISENQFDRLIIAEAVDDGWLKNTAMADTIKARLIIV